MPKEKQVKGSKSIFHLIDIYCDGPTLQEMASLDKRIVRGYTFNPTLFRSIGVTNYLDHCRTVLTASDGLAVSFEVIADDESGMIRQADILSGLGENVYVKIPVTYTNGQTTLQVIKALSEEGVKLNITAVFTVGQVNLILPALRETKSVISVFSGRLYDIGADATVETQKITEKVHAESNCLVLWASPRMVYDVKSAYKAGCDIITMQAGLIKKLALFDKSPENYSLDTVKMFYQDAIASGYKL